MAAVIWHDGRHYYGKPTDGGASFIIFEFIVLPWPINSSSLEIRTVRDLLARTRAPTRANFSALRARSLVL